MIIVQDIVLEEKSWGEKNFIKAKTGRFAAYVGV